MTKRGLAIAALGLAALGLVAGCGGDVSSLISSDAKLREKVMGVIGGNGALAGQMVDRLLAADSTKAIVLDRLFANGDAVQAILVRVAKNPTTVEGVLRLAVQDTAMKTHVMTLIKGMEIGATAAR